ncbi:DUF4124 domain-containing protein [Simiduia curdlanivorans]|uniref:DUF4124 domain-containing protein n=1 Tax=Simiduia curdlanivorans TaxID=1492769 RepID=A0ABV8V5F1_9GAMM|nr:DUF4124 domain-containing protein [Simiduia curdlanivorans]MDN3637402.1 DUF4124 domain-containing protein [Simiduia curdlanivorans]
MKLLIAAAIALSMSAIAMAQVYKTTDENGRTVYTDRPSDDAESVEMREINTAPPISARPNTRQSKAEKPALDYRVHITSPENETYLTPGERNLTVAFMVNQPLVDGVRAQLLSNGSPVGSSTTGSSITLPEVERGEHQVSVIIYDSEDQILAESAPITVYSHRTTVPKAKPKSGN